jgi:transcriptional regulator with XRE-family HTH domain
MARVRLNPERLTAELAKRRLTQQELAKLAGIPPETLSRAMHGRPLEMRTFAAISKALVKTKVKPGADLVLSGEA